MKKVFCKNSDCLVSFTICWLYYQNQNLYLTYYISYMYYDFLWSDPESDPDNLIGSGSGKKVWIRADPDPQHWVDV